MTTIIGLVIYLLTGFALVQGTLYISKYDLGNDWFIKAKILGFAAAAWPIFIAMMVGYWFWACYHSIKHWIKGYI